MSSPAAATVPAGAGQARSRAAATPAAWKALGFLVGLPDRLVVWALCAMVATSVTVVLAVFHPYTVFPLFLVLVAVTWRWSPRAPAAARTEIVAVVLVLLGAVVWVLVQRPYFGELLSVRRDAAIYTLRGVWLMNHASPDVQITPQLLAIKHAVPTAGLDFGTETGRLTRYFQSTTVVPGLIAAVGWVGGIPRLLQANLLIGAMAMVAVFAVARRMAGPVFALVPTVALAVSMPMTAFSRVPFTEPLSMISTMACLLGLWTAAKERRPVLWLLAGVGAGGVAVARIDGWLVVIGGLAGFAIWGAFATSRDGRRRVLRSLMWFSATALPVGALGLADLVIHSPDYLRVLGPSAKPLVAAVPVVLAAAVLVTVLPVVRTCAGWVAARSRTIGLSAVVVVTLAIIGFLVRPLVSTAHRTVIPAFQTEVRLRQVREGLPIDISRSYDEQSLVWMAWYQGWVAVLLGCAAVVWAVWVGIRRRQVALVLVTAVVGVNAMLYLYVVSITPDQIWAMRRFLPVILPGGLLLLAWLLQEVYRNRARLAARWAPTVNPLAVGRAVSGVLVVLALIVAVWPGAVWVKMFPVREGAGQYNFVQLICQRVENQKVLLIGDIPQMGYYQPTFRNFCGSEVITLPKNATPATVATVVSMWGTGPVNVISFYPGGVPWATPPPAQPTFSVTYNMWESTLSRIPKIPNTETTKAWLGVARPDGTVVPG